MRRGRLDEPARERLDPIDCRRRPSGGASGCGSIPRQSGEPTAARRSSSRWSAVPHPPTPAPAARGAPSAGSRLGARVDDRSRSRGIPPKSSRSSVPTRSTSSPAPAMAAPHRARRRSRRTSRGHGASATLRAAPPRRRVGRREPHAGHRQHRLDVPLPYGARRASSSARVQPRSRAGSTRSTTSRPGRFGSPNGPTGKGRGNAAKASEDSIDDPGRT